MTLLGLVVAEETQGAVYAYFDSGTEVSWLSPSISMSLHNDGESAVWFGGVNFFVTVGGGIEGPTIDTSVPPLGSPADGVDLLTGTIFSGAPFGQMPINPPPEPRVQGWGVAAFPPVSLGAGETKKLVTITFNSFPEGIFVLDFSPTSFADEDGGGMVEVSMPIGSYVTVVPEPADYGLVVAGGLLGLGLWRRGRRV